MSLFHNNVTNFIGNDNSTLTRSIDIQIFQKVLPKLNGSFGKLDKPLRELISLLVDDDEVSSSDITLEFLDNKNVDETKYPLSLNKLRTMYRALSFNGFTSFLE